MSRKFLIVVLVIAALLVVVFFLGVGLGARKPGKVEVKDLAGSLGKARAVELGELGISTPGACVRFGAAALRIPSGQTCSLTAPATSDWPWQRRVLRLSAGQQLHLKVSAKNGPVEGDYDPQKPSDLPLAREGNQIEILCRAAGGSGCIVSVLQ